MIKLGKTVISFHESVSLYKSQPVNPPTSIKRNPVTRQTDILN